MQMVTQILENAFRASFSQVGISNEVPILLVDASRPEFGDFQVNGVMAIAKKLKVNPRDLANQIIAKVELNGIAAKLEIAGPGFINVTLEDAYLANYLNRLSLENKFATPVNNQTVVVDLSSPNLAKEMHVGHLRSTVIGDALARIFKYLGSTVIRQNHVGDWGTQFGMLIAYLIKEQQLQRQDMEADYSHEITNYDDIKDLEDFYRKAKILFDTDAEFAATARKCVVILQQDQKNAQKHYGLFSAKAIDHVDEWALVQNYWKAFCKLSLSHCQHIYNKLNVDLSINDVRGESSYNGQLASIATHLGQQGLIVESNGAKCVFFADGELPGGEDTPFIVQKKDGGFLYSTTDLAAMDYRVHNLHADKIVYVVDARQSFHFKQLFLVAKKAGFANPNTVLMHSAFGTMMNEDGKPFKTRDGGTVKLIDLIDEAIVRAKKIVSERNPDWSEVDKINLANILAIGAIKYADLSKHRTSDYIFSFDKMLAFDGNTAPYLLYAYTRIQSILKKAESDGKALGGIIISDVIEHKLSLHLVKFGEILLTASNDCCPHYLCHYLYNLAGLFMQFYEVCPILQANDTIIIQSRLNIATKTAQILKTGLDLLGIQVVERM